MAQAIKRGSAEKAIFEVVNARQATGFGLHVSGSQEANGRGLHAEFFLRASEDGQVVFVYLDGGRSPLPYIGPMPSGPDYLGDITVLADVTVGPAEGDSQGTAGLPTLDLSGGLTLDPMVPAPDRPTTAENEESELRGLHRFDVPLGHRDNLDSIVVVLTNRQLEVACVCRSTGTEGPRRVCHVDVNIPLESGGLGSYSDLSYSSNGLLTASGDSGSGSGWETREPRTEQDGGGSDDDSLDDGLHIDDGPGNEPTGG